MRLTDAISRQAAITEFSCCELTPDGGIDANYAIDFLERLPSAQPEHIKCRDCKKYDAHDHRCRWWNHGTNEAGWCYVAERREE